jgi:hypothetical protein
VLRTISQTDAVQYTLAMLDEMLTLNPERIADMHSPSPQHPGAPAPDRAVILARMLERQDWFTQAKASDEPKPGITSKFLEWLTSQFQRPSNPDEAYLVASGALSGLLRSREVRKEYSREVPLLVWFLSSIVASWHTYVTVICRLSLFWTLCVSVPPGLENL